MKYFRNIWKLRRAAQNGKISGGDSLWRGPSCDFAVTKNDNELSEDYEGFTKVGTVEELVSYSFYGH